MGGMSALGWREVRMTEYNVEVRQLGAGRYCAKIETMICATAEEALDMARRAAMALEQAPTPSTPIDRETLARALHKAYSDADGLATKNWDKLGDEVRKGYLAEADEAIRLLCGASRPERVFACPECGPQDRCDEDGCCITHGLDLIEVADVDAAYAVKGACGRLTSDHDAERAELTAKIEDLEKRLQKMTRQQENGEDLRAEVTRLRHALDTTGRAAAHLAHVVATLTGDGDE